VDAAVAGARSALETWATAEPEARAAALERLAAAVERRAGEFVAVIATEVGCPVRVATKVQTAVPLQVLRSCAELAERHPLSETIGNSLVIKEPVGVVAAITPWNYPLQQVVAKLGPALAAGCTVVLKPSELTPLTAYLMFDAIDEAGLPPGAVNLVPGTGPEVGAALAGHAGVDMVSFTGSTAVGRSIGSVVAGRVARVALELGGKSANVILDDADLAVAVKVGVANAFLNSGQTCTAWTRMLVHHSRYDEAVALAAKAAAKYVPGDPFDENTRLGPLVSALQRKRVRGYMERAALDGARLVTGGLDAPVPETGYFVAPTIFADVDPGSRLAQEEIFGPVLAIMPFEDDDDAVRIANDSDYGLAGAVWSADESRALEIARRLQVGAVDINGGRFNPLAPFGGYKRSGFGRELGSFGVEEFLQTKAIQR
ncbi:MAG TPA: aldehyde dehydrogenase family protein, partial [Jiangellales bacterium]|nr:aldehyde dehydrogenase family protein [Jiangellales bacterium]